MKFLSYHLLASIAHLQIVVVKTLDLSFITWFRDAYERKLLSVPEFSHNIKRVIAESVLPTSANLGIYSTAGFFSQTLEVYEIQPASLGTVYREEKHLIHLYSASCVCLDFFSGFKFFNGEI